MSSAAPTCVWPLDTSCCPDWENFPAAVREAAAQTASDVLWALSGRQFGACPVTLRPCKPACPCTGCDRCGSKYSDLIGGPWFPALIAGQMFNLTCGCAQDGCGCGKQVSTVELPGPVAEIESVWIDGKALDASAYAVYDFRRLVRTDGREWPTCQDLAADLTQPGTWGVTYLRGTPVPLAGLKAAGAFACELAKACTGGRCRIPWQVTNVTRDGMSWQLDPSAFYAKGLTGLPETDVWLSAVNPGKNRRPSSVWSPDTAERGSMRTWPGEVTPA